MLTRSSTRPSTLCSENSWKDPRRKQTELGREDGLGPWHTSRCLVQSKERDYQLLCWAPKVQGQLRAVLLRARCWAKWGMEREKQLQEGVWETRSMERGRNTRAWLRDVQGGALSGRKRHRHVLDKEGGRVEAGVSPWVRRHGVAQGSPARCPPCAVTEHHFSQRGPQNTSPGPALPRRGSHGPTDTS